MLKKLFFTATFALGVSSVFAQKTFDNGSLTYKLTTDIKEEQSMNMDVDAGLTIHIREKEAKAIMTMTATVMEQTMESRIENLINSESKTGLCSMEMFGEKVAAKVTPEDYDNMLQRIYGFEIENIEPTDETKDILGYSCKKVIATIDDKGTKLEVFYTTAIKPVPIEGLSSVYMKGIEGLPLEYRILTPKADLTFEVTDIKENNIKASDFNYEIPEGYREVPYSELNQMRVGM